MGAKGRRAAGLAAAALGAVGAGIAAARLDAHVARTADGWALIYTRRAPDGSRVRVLRQGGVYQSATYLGARRFEPVFCYHRAIDAVFDAGDALRAATGHGVRRVLALGGGGYAWPKHALCAHPELSLDVVEIDPAVERIARRWFYVDELERRAGGRLHLITADGRAFLEDASAAGERYDAIVNDTFAGAEPVRPLATVEAARLAHACLEPGGLYLMNVVSCGAGSDQGFLRDEVATLSGVFAHVSVVLATDEVWGGEDNYLLIAGDEPHEFEDAVPYDEEFLGCPLYDTG